MTPQEDKLSEKETWEGEHLSELALSCLADAQDVLDPVAKVHAETCAECMLRIGAMALESHDVGAALVVAQQVRVQQATAAHRFPTVLVAAAVLVALVAGAPAAMDALPRVASWITSAPEIAAVFTTSALALGKGVSSSVSLVATFALALLGYAVARTSREKTGVSS
jgi:energy-converting hydrogenase Eha subunit A